MALTLENTMSPEAVPGILQRLATQYRQDQANLQDTWQDPQAGRVWGELAKILERASDQAKVTVDTYFG
jgi:hypothetical protein